MDQVENGGKIVKVGSTDTLEFGPGAWTQVLPFRKYQPIQRAETEFSTIISLLDKMRTTAIEHSNEVGRLEGEIEHLEDSIEQILHPKKPMPIPMEYPEPPIPEEIFLLTAGGSAQTLTIQKSLHQKLRK